VKNLAESASAYLGTHLAPTTVKKFADGEVSVKIGQSVSGKHCYIIQSTSPPSVNDALMELLLMISACKRAGATSVTCIIPYFGYARQDRRGRANEATPISAADVS
jgi:ribose-phosphate pyrophosphokinase